MAVAPVYEAHRFALIGVLVTYARARETLSYSELVAQAHLPLNMKTNPIHRNLLSDWLFRLAVEEDAASLPLLPALVVRSSTGQPGPGFFGMLADLGRTREGESESAAHQRELRAVYSFYAAGTRGFVEAWVVPSTDRDRTAIEKTPVRFFLLPVRYDPPRAEFILLHTENSSEGHAGEHVTPEWLTDSWDLLRSMPEHRFVLRGNSTFWVLASWTPEGSGRRVRVHLEPECRVVDVRKVREYPDGSSAFEVLYADGIRTWGKVRRRNGVLNFFDHDYHRDGWPEPPFEMIAAALDSKIPG